MSKTAQNANAFSRLPPRSPNKYANTQQHTINKDKSTMEDPNFFGPSDTDHSD